MLGSMSSVPPSLASKNDRRRKFWQIQSQMLCWGFGSHWSKSLWARWHGWSMRVLIGASSPGLRPIRRSLASNIRSSSGTVASGFDRSKLGLAASATNQRDSETTALSRYPSHRVHILQLCQCAFCRKKLCDQSRYCNVEYCRTLDTTKAGCRQSEV